VVEDELGRLSSLPFSRMDSGTGGHTTPLSTPSAPGRHPPSLFLATVRPPKAAIDADGSAVEEMAPSSPPEAAGCAVEEMAPSSPPEAAADAEEDLAALLSLSLASHDHGVQG
jgi:hypothetical protein